MSVRLSLFGSLTQELRRPPGRAPDLGSYSVSTKETISTLNRLSLVAGKRAPLLWLRSMAMRSFQPIPKEALPKQYLPRAVGLPEGRRRRVDYLTEGWNWQYRNPWFGDERLHISCTGSFFSTPNVTVLNVDDLVEQNVYLRWNGNGSLVSNAQPPEIDFEAAVRSDPNATMVVADEADVHDIRDTDTFMDRFWSSRASSFDRKLPKEKVAMELLRRHLSVEQRLELLSMGYFTVIGSEGGVFRVHDDPAGWSVDELERGRIIASWCIVPGPYTVQAGADVVIANENLDEAWPVGDVLLARKLMIETDEARFREVANRELKILEKANHKPLVELARLALLLIDHATDHEWWNAILRSMKAKHTPIEAVHA